MDQETEKLRAYICDFISNCEDEILLQKMLDAAKKYYNEE